MAALTLRSWFDDSERDDKEHTVAALAGCVGTSFQWDDFSARWKANVLDAFDLDYLHMKEVRSGYGKFARFQDASECIALSKGIIKSFSDSQIRPFGSVIRIGDLKRFNKERSKQLSQLSLNIYGCMRLIGFIYGPKLNDDTIVEMTIDRAANAGQAIRVAKQYATTDTQFPQMAEFIQPHVLGRGELARKIYAMQAADFIAWECRKNVETYHGWFEEREDGKKRISRIEWAEKTDTLWPFARQSMARFMLGTNTLLECWTYDRLALENQARNGAWSQSAGK